VVQFRVITVNTFESTQGEAEIENISQKLSSSRRNLVHFTETVKDG
jgi:hypothetical protein